MAIRPINPSTVSAILSAVFMLGVVGYLGFVYTKTAPTPVDETPHSYDTAVISKELNPQNEKSVFALTVLLGTPTQQQSGTIQYSGSELGKADITRAGQ